MRFKLEGWKVRFMVAASVVHRYGERNLSTKQRDVPGDEAATLRTRIGAVNSFSAGAKAGQPLWITS